MNNFQPKNYYSLLSIFFIERICHYGIRALLIMFMIDNLLIPVQKAGYYYGYYVGLASISILLGGIIADTWLGRRKTLILSLILMILGLVLLTISAITSYSILFFISLVFASLGRMFSPVFFTTLNNLYTKENDLRRESGFILIFFALSLGAFLGPILSSFLMEKINISLSFSIATLLMISCLIILKNINKNIDLKDDYISTSSKKSLLIMLIIFILVYLPAQIGSNINLEISMSESFYNYGTTIARIITSLPSFIFYLILAFILFSLAKKNKAPSTINKFLLGLFFILLGSIFFILINSNQTIKTLPTLYSVFIFMILAEVLIEPIVLSLITRIAPRKWENIFVAIWLSLIAYLTHILFFKLETSTRTNILIVTAALLILFFNRKKLSNLIS